MLRSVLLRFGLCAALLPLAGCELLSTGDDREDPLRFTSVSAGYQHSCALTTDGEAYCWGDNGSGQLGLGTSDRLPAGEPRKVAGGLRFRSLHTGRNTTCGLDANGALYCWGALQDRVVFEPFPQFQGTRFAGISPHLHNHVCGVTADRTVGCWGRNQTGVAVAFPAAAPTPAPGATEFTEVSVGAYETGLGGSLSSFRGHVCGLKGNGAAYCWGDDSYGQLGTGDVARRPSDVTPVAGGLSFRAVRAGLVTTCGLDTGGALYCWGRELGRVPQRLGPSLRFESLDMGARHGCAVTAAGEAYCWGRNASGQLGTGTLAPSPEPQAVQGGVRFRAVSAAGYSEHEGSESGGAHTCGISTDQRVYCWGSNDSGQLGTRSRAGSLVPVLVAEPARGS